MNYKEIKAIEKFLSSKKRKSPTPKDISDARLHLIHIKDKIGEEELLNLRILYLGKLAASPLASNSITIIAILVTIIIFLLSTPSQSLLVDTIFKGVITFTMLTLMIYIHSLNTKNTQSSVIYTIIINLIDEIILLKK